MGKLYEIGQVVKNYKITGFEGKGSKFKYQCECLNCGNKTSITGTGLRKSIGRGCLNCWNEQFVHYDMIGKRYGCYTVIGIGIRKGCRNEQHYICKCDCGNETELTKSQITQKNHICCKKCRGNYLKTNNGSYKHGDTKSQLYTVWCNMRSRCYSEKSNRYSTYGAKGIKVCDEWLGNNGYQNFMDWAYANGYSTERTETGHIKYTLDRIDFNGNYEPSNCRWITIQEQQNNRKDNKYITYNGETHTMAEWARILNVPYHRIQSRMINGMDFEDAIKDCNYHDKRHTLFGEKKTLDELSQIIGCSVPVISRSLRKGITLEELYKKWRG
jgi:hypothetical protein